MAGKLRDWQVPQAGLGGKTAPIPRGTGKKKGVFWKTPRKPNPVRELELMMKFDSGTNKGTKRRKNV